MSKLSGTSQLPQLQMNYFLNGLIVNVQNLKIDTNQ